MTTAAEIYKEYESAWTNPEGYYRLPKLLSCVKKAIQSGAADDALVINYAEILLDLNRNEEALRWLLEHPLSYKEYYENLGIAYAKNDHSNLQNIRRNSLEARNHPKCPNAIVAYIDYQGM